MSKKLDNMFVVRWSSENQADGEYECGNFDFCHKTEKKAVKAMLDDMNETKADFDDKIDEVKSDTFMGDDEIETCTLTVTRAGSGETTIYRWWVDKLAIDD